MRSRRSRRVGAGAPSATMARDGGAHAPGHWKGWPLCQRQSGRARKYDAFEARACTQPGLSQHAALRRPPGPKMCRRHRFFQQEKGKHARAVLTAEGRRARCGARAGLRRLVRGRPRRHDRVRRAARHSRGTGVRSGRAVLGGQRLHTGLRRIPAARRAVGGSRRAARDVRAGHGPVHGRPAGRRAGRVGRAAARRAGGAGPRRGAADAGDAVRADHDLRRARQASPRAGHLERCGRGRGRVGPGHRRRADAVGRVAVGVLRQRPGRRAGRRGRRRGAAGPVGHRSPSPAGST